MLTPNQADGSRGVSVEAAIRPEFRRDPITLADLSIKREYVSRYSVLHGFVAIRNHRRRTKAAHPRQRQLARLSDFSQCSLVGPPDGQRTRPRIVKAWSALRAENPSFHGVPSPAPRSRLPARQETANSPAAMRRQGFHARSLYRSGRRHAQRQGRRFRFRRTAYRQRPAADRRLARAGRHRRAIV